MRYALAHLSSFFLSSFNRLHTFGALLLSLVFLLFVPTMFASVSGLGGQPALRGCAVGCLHAQVVLSWGRVDDSCLLVGFQTRIICFYTVERCAVKQIETANEKHQIRNQEKEIIL